jgi:hypothetical protein
MIINLGLPEISLGVILFAIIQLWFSERLKTSLQKENSIFLENLKWDLKIREQAIRVAEYLALARSLTENSSIEDYRKANQLSWELAMWLPANIYKEMVAAIVCPNNTTNELTTVVKVRNLLLGKNSSKNTGNLTADNIAHHAPAIGKNKNHEQP